MAEREDITAVQLSAIERRRARARARHAQMVAADPEYNAKRYRRWLELHPNGNQEQYQRAIQRDPEHNRRKHQQRTARAIASGHSTKKTKRRATRRTESKKKRDRERYLKNKATIIERVVRRQKERYSTDAAYCVYQALRSRMRYAVKSQVARRSSRSCALIGCSPKHLAAHLESQFTEGMSWSNRSEWHIDHIIPVSAFDLTTKEGQEAAFHYTNLRPLWALDNQRKSAKPPALQRRFAFGYVMLADQRRKPGTEGRPSTERRRA